jgi:biopolymer transport protein ExbB
MSKNLFNINQKNYFLIWITSFLCFVSPFAHAEWNAEWPNRQKISINADGITQPVSQPTVVVRLHSGNFDFTGVNVDGSDVRFIAQDDKTELKFYVEKFDALNELAVIWVQLPKVDAAEKEPHFWIYSGNEAATSTSSAQTIVNANTVAAFHFSEKSLFQDSSATGLEAGGEITSQKAGLLGEAAVFAAKPFVIPVNPALKHTAGAGYTWSAWIKPASLPQTAILYSQNDSVSLKIDGQKLSLTVGTSNIAGGDIKAAAWQHVVFTLDGGKASIYVNGAQVGTGKAPGVDAETDVKIGEGFTGELDELEIANVARSADFIKLVAMSQGVDSQLLKISAGEGGEEEGEGEGEANYLKILVDSLTLDAEIVIGILAVMFLISVWVMWKKAMLVSRTDKDNKKFLARFQKAGTGDLLDLDKGANYPNSTLFGLYKAGLREIRKRQHPDQKLALSGASMDAIKAAIDADLVRETQKQNAGMVLLTIAISGGPFLGLLGTVVGVMITFAAIAAAGDVNVNAIAPGIAAALLATVAGLAVAIPALFGYNYLASRIKNITIAMQIFVDEFVTRTAELYGKE